MVQKDRAWPNRTEFGLKGQSLGKKREQRPEHQTGQLATLLTKLRAGTVKRKPKEVHCLKCQVAVITKQTEAGNA